MAQSPRRPINLDRIFKADAVDQNKAPRLADVLKFRPCEDICEEQSTKIWKYQGIELFNGPGACHVFKSQLGKKNPLLRQTSTFYTLNAGCYSSTYSCPREESSCTIILFVYWCWQPDSLFFSKIKYKLHLYWEEERSRHSNSSLQKLSYALAGVFSALLYTTSCFFFTNTAHSDNPAKVH